MHNKVYKESADQEVFKTVWAGETDSEMVAV